MPDGTMIKYFLSLQLPDLSKNKLAEAAEHLSTEFGDVLDAPMKRGSYHVTLGVMEMTEDKVDEMERLRFNLQTFLDTLTVRELVFEEVGWFDDGAVYLKLDDERGTDMIKPMRVMIEEVCEKENIKLFKLKYFHITLFRKNTIKEGTQLRLNDCCVIPFGPRGVTGDLGTIDTVDLRKVKNW